MVHGRGMWIFRGQNIPPIMKEECFDLDLYTWQKVDPSDPVRCFCYSLPESTSNVIALFSRKVWRCLL